MTRRLISLCLALGTMLALTGVALAGGWAVVTLDSLPREIRAGEPLTLGFMVRQHGITPTESITPFLSARQVATGETLRVAARKEGVPGHYVVDVTFPSAGAWTWKVTPDPFEATEFGTVTVLAAGAKPSASSPTSLVSIPGETVTLARLGLRGLGMIALLGAVILAARRRAALQPQATPGR